MEKLLILTEAGKKIGLGHIKRSLAIAKEHSYAKIVAFVDGEINLHKNIELLDWHTDYEKIIDLSKEYQSVVIDSYLATKDTLQKIKEHFKKVFVLDDNNRIIYPAQVIINPNIYGDEIDYSNQNALTYGGKKYIIISDGIVENKKPKTIKAVKNILITLGGDDHNKLTPVIANFLHQYYSNITILAGTTKYKEELDVVIDKPNIKILDHLEEKALTKEFLNSDITICAGGSTMHQLAFLGTPFIPIQTGLDQEKNIQSYIKNKIVKKHLKAGEDNLLNDLLFLLKDLEDINTRKDLSFKMQTLISPKGVKNIVEIIKK